MDDLERAADQLVEAMESMSEGVQERLHGLSALSCEESLLLREGLAGGSPAIDGLARRLLDDWPVLTVHERIAALLTIAAALQAHGDSRSQAALGTHQALAT